MSTAPKRSAQALTLPLPCPTLLAQGPSDGPPLRGGGWTRGGGGGNPSVLPLDRDDGPSEPHGGRCHSSYAFGECRCTCKPKRVAQQRQSPSPSEGAATRPKRFWPPEWEWGGGGGGGAAGAGVPGTPNNRTSKRSPRCTNHFEHTYVGVLNNTIPPGGVRSQ